MGVAGFCIKHKVTTILAFVIITVFGVVFFSNLKLSLMPNIEYPAAYVMCTYPGANPEDIEELVTRPLESCISTLSGVKSMDSTSSENVCMVMINYEDGTDVDQAAVKLREKFDALTLPDGCSDPVINNYNVNDMMPVAVVALRGDDLNQLQSTADDMVVPALERIDGIASAQVNGGVKSQITVEANATLLAGYNMSISYLSNYLAGSNVLYPGGDVHNGSQKLTVSTDGKYQSVEDVSNTLIPLPAGGGSVRLGEISTVYLESTLQDSAAKVGDQYCVILTVNKRSGTNEVEAVSDVKSVLEKLKSSNAALDYVTVYDSSEYIKIVAANALENILMGVILSAIVVFLFLKRPGATITISLSMPFCVITVFLIMNLLHITLNMMSLGGIAICIGMVVDNSIVVLENIYRYAGNGYNKYDSCVLATKEVVFPVTASTFTTIAVFLPIGLSGGLVGMMFKDFALTVVFLILVSLVIALTLVPLMCYFLLDENKVRIQKLMAQSHISRGQTLLEKLSQKYQRILRFFLRKRAVAVLISVGLVVVFLASCINTNMVLVPDMDQGMVNLSLSMPSGSKLEDTMAYSDRITQIAQEDCPELDNLYIIGEKESATIVLNLVDLSQRSRSSKEIADDLQEKTKDIAGCDITVSDYSMMGNMTGSHDIDVKIIGDDYDALTQIAGDLTPKVAALDDAKNVKNSVEDTIPAVKVSVRRDAAEQYGLTAAAIGSAVRAELTGVTSTTMTIDGKDLDVVVRGNGTSAESLDALRSMPIAASTGGSVPLSAVAGVSVVLSPQSITRSDQSRQVEITGDTHSGSSTAVTKQIQEILDGYHLPDGYTAKVSGTNSEMMENFEKLALALLVAIGLVYFILAAQFESFIMPVIVMLILPIALSGALFGLPLTGQDLSMVALLGLVMLAGVVVNSSIILVDYINVRRAKGREKDQAILEACPLRVRPIMMTTLTTILALIPMTAGWGGEGAELMQPLGVVMMSGMIISTITTLFFTPVYYSLLDSLTARVDGPFRRRRERHAEKLRKKLAALEEAQPNVKL